MAVALTGRLICTSADQAARVRAHLAEHIRLTRAEPGCLHFTVVPLDDLVWQVDERFTDRAAFAAHQARAAASAWAAATADIARDYRLFDD